jgi:sec-independent protein translocase protein TatC
VEEISLLCQNRGVNNFQKSIDKYAVYLEELRSNIVFLTKIFVVVFILGFLGTSPIIKFMLSKIQIEGVKIVTTSPFQLIDLAMSIGFFTACVVIIPIFIFQLYLFIKPGLLKKERSTFLLSLPLGVVMYLVGFLYGCGTLYYAVKFVAHINVGLGVVNYWDIGLFISQIVFTSSLLGILFILPLVVTFLIRMGILSVSFLKSKRRHVVAGIFVLVSLLPPTDGLSLVLMAVPLILIFEITVLFNKTRKEQILLEN